ncbi:MAG: DUF692 domain-containing protein [Leptospira sp.]|nr:DUF692 domain-containing protein [Leptospira sp.]
MKTKQVTGTGVGLRPQHYPYLSDMQSTSVEWFEAISENYMDTFGRPLDVLQKIRRNFPVALHGVSLSIASADGIDLAYLKKLDELIKRVDPFIVSDHLCWTRSGGFNLHDLLPFPFTKESRDIIIQNISVVQEFLKREFVLENISSYLSFSEQEFTEWEFISEISRISGCKILLDINNVYVNAKNHDFNPEAFLNGISARSVSQIHLAGFSDMGDYLFDTHSNPISHDVWKLFESAISRIPEVPVLIEWDEDIPDFTDLEKEAAKAQKIKRKFISVS